MCCGKRFHRVAKQRTTGAGPVLFGFVAAEARPAARREQVLRAIYEANGLEALDYDSEIDCAVLGDGCFKVVWDPEEGRVRVTAPDVAGIFVWLYPDDHSRIWRLAHRYTVDPLAIRQQEQYYPQILQTNQRNPAVTEVWPAEMWEVWHDGALLERRANPYGVIPYVVYPNLRRPKQFFGESDIAAIREPRSRIGRSCGITESGHLAGLDLECDHRRWW